MIPVDERVSFNLPGEVVRYEKAESLLKLALEMQGSGEGLSLADIQERHGVSRRTAERMRDALERIFPQMEQANPGELPKRWRIPGGTLNRLVNITAEELAELNSAINIFQRDNLSEQARFLENLLAKIRAVMKPSAIMRVEPDLEILLEAEGLAMRPGPRITVKEGVLEKLREAVIACKRVWVHYRAVGTGRLSRQLICPYGFLYGGKNYLVGYSLGMRGYRLLSLGNIEKVDITDKTFERREDFSLKEYAERSFGVFQEEPFRVVWKFKKEVADSAREFVFHPTQKMETQKDGSLLVSFTAGGALEMAWHLYRWGDSVEVLQPKDFWDRIEK